ncbi:histidine phosphatase family protein [Pseudomonas sp. RGM2987]|uniref:histidine phosphatase family protein n=1 Tax=Pseudomonas sp. RGM2987 TaxID=2930090 RepID=UPI001FD684C1|nr:histidine phosphatase family protein [Pseudomonas sp. RGM2987]
MQATRLTLICHARTVAQKQARFGLDEPLDADWLAKRADSDHRCRGVGQWLCGPELRARQSAEWFGAEPQVTPALADCDFGRWRGSCVDDLLKTEPQAVQTWLDDPQAAPHGGESIARLCQRVDEWMASLQDRPGHVLAVTHPFVIRAALVTALGCPAASFNRIDIEPLSAVELRFNGVWRLRIQESS